MRLKVWRRLGLAACAGLALSSAAGPTQAPGERGRSPLAANVNRPQGLSLLTYNVHGLPWPLALGRDEAFGTIAARLRQLRAAGAQPHIVVLQEAFTAAAEQIGQEAGYRYEAEGPPAEMRSDAPPTSADLKFESGKSWLKGEGLGKALDSGLMILSDYPILAVRRAAFPDYACAGYDCLANKGVLMAVVRPPGSATPVEIVTTHLNSHAASGVGDRRSTYAYQRQTDTLARFLKANAIPGYPMVFAGDFNVGQRPVRQFALLSRIGAALRSDGYRMPQDALHDCTRLGAACPGAASPDARTALARGRDWQFFAASPRYAMGVRDIRILFGHEPLGGMLSDHIGYEADYRLAAPATRENGRRPAPPARTAGLGQALVRRSMMEPDRPRHV